MKILYFFYQYPLYKQGSYFQEFLNAICKKINKAGLISYYYPNTIFKKPNNLKIYWLKKPDLGLFNEPIYIIKSIIKVLTDSCYKNFSLINCIGPRGLIAGLILRKKHKIPLILTVEMLNTNKGYKNKIINFFTKLLITKLSIDYYICWSYFYQKKLVNWGIKKDKISVIYPGINLKKYNAKISGSKIKHKYSPKEPLIVFAKPLYLHHLKAVKIIVKALNRIKTKAKINLLLGTGQAKDQIIAFAKKLNLLKQIKFMPQVGFPKIPEYIAAADLIVLPFTYAPTVSRSLLEALALGKPIIISAKGEVKYILRNNKHALLVKNNAKDFAKAILKILKNRALKKKLSLNTLALIKKDFSLQKSANKTIILYKKLIKNG